MSLLARRLAWQRIQRSERPADVRLAILSSFTAEPLCPYLGMALEEAGLATDLQVGPYNQIAQQCLDPGGETALWAPSVLVVWPRLEDIWAARPCPLDGPSGPYVDELLELVDVAVSAAAAWGATLVFLLPPVPEVRPLGVGDAGNALGVFAVATAAREAARTRLAAVPGTVVADVEEVVRAIGSDGAVDWAREASARIPYREDVFDAVARRVARLLVLHRRGACKVAVIDADNTLWGGVVGEDGVAGIDLFDNGPGEAYRGFQRYLLELRRAGLLLALVSKNNEGDVWAAFSRREMVLGRSDLAAWRIGWGPKSTSIREIAAELNLGESAMVLIDDSDLERSEVEQTLPTVRTLPMPLDPERWHAVVGRSGELDRLPPTHADQQRARSYEDEGKRRVLRSTVTAEEFLASLELTVDIVPPDATDLPRFAQLVAKTNQLTLGGARRSEAELARCLADDRFVGRVVAARDRFGDYGIVGGFLIDRHPPDRPGASVLDTFVLSCRALGRGVEVAMVATAAALADGPLLVTVHEAARNAPARQLFTALGARVGEQQPLVAPGWPPHVRLRSEVGS